VIDAGANMHFALSQEDPTYDTGYRTTTYGRGIASARRVIGPFSNDLGETGTLVATHE